MKPEYYKNEKNIDIIDFCKMYDLNFNRGNVLKYIARAGKKENELEDLKKAMEYLKREIEHIMTLKEKFLELVSEEKSNTLEKIRNRRQEKMDNYAIEILERYHNSLFIIPLKEGEAKRIVEHIKKEKGL